MPAQETPTWPGKLLTNDRLAFWLFDRQEAEGNAPSRGLPPAFPSPFTKSALSLGLATKVEVQEF